MDNMEKRIREILLGMVDDDKRKELISNYDDFDIIEDLEFDSLDIMNFIMNICDEFDMEIDNGEDFIESVYKLRSLLDWLKAYRRNNKDE